MLTTPAQNWARRTVARSLVRSLTRSLMAAAPLAALAAPSLASAGGPPAPIRLVSHAETETTIAETAISETAISEISIVDEDTSLLVEDLAELTDADESALFDELLLAGRRDCPPCPQVCPPAPACPPAQIAPQAMPQQGMPGEVIMPGETIVPGESYAPAPPMESVPIEPSIVQPSTPFAPSTPLAPATPIEPIAPAAPVTPIEPSAPAVEASDVVAPSNVVAAPSLENLVASAGPSPAASFGAGLSGGGLLASRDVPAMIGDFFGGGGSRSVCLPGLAESIRPQVVNDALGISGAGLFETIVGAPGDPVRFPVFIGQNGQTVVGNIASVQTRDFINSTQFVQGVGIFNGVESPGDVRFELQPIGSAASGNSDAFLNAVSERIRQDPRTGLAGRDGAVVIGPGQATLTPPAGFPTPQASQQDGMITSLDPNQPLPQDVDLFALGFTADFQPVEELSLPIESLAGRVKLVENSSPVPRDRIIFNYSFFKNTALLPGGVDVQRFTPGFEKTFFGGLASIEVRSPFAITVDSDLVTGAGGVTSDNSRLQHGDLTTTLKLSLFETDTFLLGAGLGIALPTADDVSVALSNGVEALRVDNDSPHLMPYVGLTYAPNRRVFTQFVAQVDFATHSDDVFVNLNPSGILGAPTGLTRVGGLDDPTFLYLDASAGYWVYRDSRARGLTGLALTAEAHYNTIVEESGSVRADVPFVGTKSIIGGQDDFGQLNLLAGIVAEINNDDMITFAYGTPVTDDRIFNGEFRVNYTHRFGRSSRRSNPANYVPLPN